MEPGTSAPADLADELSEALELALSTGETERWVTLLRENPAADPLGAIVDSPQHSRLFEQIGQQSFVAWLEDAKRWKEQQYRDPRDEGHAEVRVLYEAWSHLESGLIERLTDSAPAVPDFPNAGGVLCFVAKLRYCVVLRFQFHGATPSLSPLTVVERPRAAFAVWETIDAAEPGRRDALRKMLVSGHKLIYHRGVLTHVDRRDDETVFGPSIDTLVMAELLASDVYEQPSEGRLSFLEIGTGSGMLCAEALSQLDRADRVMGIEMDFGSLACTFKNLTIANGGLDPLKHRNCSLLGGEFDPTVLAERFDLIVCNPPYIAALEKALPNETGSEDYLRAVGGEGLIDTLLAALPRMLTDEGRLLLMLNNMAVERVIESLPEGFTASRPFGEGGYSVLFEVEAVFERPATLNELVKTGMLTPVDDALEHTLHPLWIRRA